MKTSSIPAMVGHSDLVAESMDIRADRCGADHQVGSFIEDIGLALPATPQDDVTPIVAASHEESLDPQLQIPVKRRPHCDHRHAERLNNSDQKTLGAVIKDRRKALGLSQRQLAERLGVKAAHVAYLELNRRRPSLSLLARIANVLCLESRSLLILAHPEAGLLLATPKKPARSRNGDVWRRFMADKALLAQHRIEPRELKVLSQVNLLGKVAVPRQFLFILNSIRQAIEDE